MNILELQQHFEETIRDAEKEVYGGPAVRIFTIYKDVIMYLVSSDKLAMSDREQKFWDYTKQYTLSALYRVAEHYRKENNISPMNYEQQAYHNRENTIEEWRGWES